MARVLVTGGSGFVGLNIVEALLRRADGVVLFADRPPGRSVVAELSGLGDLTLATGDVRDPDSVRAAAKGCTALIHGAAVTPAGSDVATARRAVEVNVIGSLNVLEATAALARSVCIGSASVYGAAARAGSPLGDETTPPRPESVYAVSKYAAERLVASLARAQGRDLRLVRIGSVYGPWEHDTGVRETLSPIFQATRAVLCGRRNLVLPRAGRRDWIHGSDVAGAILAVLDRAEPPGGIVDIGLGHEWAVADWCSRLAARFPDLRVRMAGVGETPSLNYHGDADRPPLDITRLEREIGFTPAFDLERGFEDYMSWLSRHPEFVAEANSHD